ncbi:MAG: Ni/Fe-hydrogenase, b-type cytochrome subunit [Acidobacteriota bacterium]|nr:Ni/Fe-hydrogenase, b-type cytochrome subunit [Acidobacteriota bacterium]
MNAAAQSAARVASPVSGENIVRVYVWEWPVRIAHWVIFLSIVVLSFTGYYLYDPFIISRGHDAFVMGTMRFIHEVTGFTFIAAFLLRLYWFFKGNRWARWRQFLLVDPEQWRGARNMLRYYLFLRRQPESRVGHNPLAGATYATIYTFIFIEVLTGLALFNHVRHSAVLGFFIGWLPSLIGIQYLREIHFLIMFILVAFFVHHIYSAWLMSIEERSGLMGSIFSGYKNLPADFLAADPASRHEREFPIVGPGWAYWRHRGKTHGQKSTAAGSRSGTSGR